MKFSPEQIAQIDEYGELRRQIQIHKPVADRAEQLSKIIQGWYELQPADQAFTAQGNRYDVQVGAREKVRKVFDIGKLFKIVGATKFLRIVKVNLTDLDRELPIEKHPEFLSEKQEGKRRLTPVMRPIPMVASDRFLAKKKLAA